MAKIKFFNASTFNKNVKCTIHKSGKIGFSSGAIKRMSLDKLYGVKIGTNEDDTEENDLYMACIMDEDKSAFKLIKAGSYYYINAKPLLEELKVDYRNEKITFIYDIIEVEIEDQKIFKLIKREVKKGKKE